MPCPCFVEGTQRAPTKGKFEARNSKLETITNDKKPNVPNGCVSDLRFGVEYFRILKLFRISDSNFELGLGHLRERSEIMTMASEMPSEHIHGIDFVRTGPETLAGRYLRMFWQ